MQNEEKETDFISLAEGSKISGYHQDYLGALCRTGKLPGQKIGRNWVVSRCALEKFLNKDEPAAAAALEAGGDVNIDETLASAEAPNQPEFEIMSAGQISTKLEGLKYKVSTLKVEHRLDELAEQVSALQTATPPTAAHTEYPAIVDASSLEVFSDQVAGQQIKQKVKDRVFSRLSLASASLLVGIFLVLGLLVAGVESFKAIAQPDKTTSIFYHVQRPEGKSPATKTAPQRQFAIPSSDTKGAGLATPTSAGAQPSAKVLGLSTTPVSLSGFDIQGLDQLILQNIQEVIAAGWWPINQAAGAATNGGQSSSSNISNPVPTPAYAPITYIQPAPFQNFNGASVLSATDLSSQRFVTNTATVSDTATIQNLVVGNNATVGGNLTVTGGITGVINPALTLGSVAFQGSSILAQDNASFFWDDTANALGVGTNTINASTILQLDSTVKGFLTPRMTTVQRDAISSPATGLLIYNTSSAKFNFYDGSVWTEVVSGSISSALSGLTGATGDASINNSAHNIVWNWQLAGAESAFTFGENTASTGGSSNQYIVQAATLASSTATPLYVKNLGAARSFQVDDSAADASPFIIDASGNVTTGADLTITGDDLFLATNTDGFILVADGTNYNPVAVSGDITITNAGVTAIGASKVTNTMLAGSIAASKLVGTDIATVGTITTGTWNGSVIAPAYGGTGVANNAASTLTISGNFATTLTVSATTGVTLPTSGTLYGTATDSITSANLLGSLTNETGSGVAVFATSPTLVTPVLGAATYTTLSGGNITDSALTAGRVTFAGTAGILQDDADLLFSTDTLTVTKLAATTMVGNLIATDNTYDIGASGATRFRTGYFGTSLVAPTINATTALQINGTSINTGGTLANVAYLDQANIFTAAQGVNVSSSAALFAGPNGNTNPVLRVITNVASAATGLSITGNAAGSGVTLTALSSGTNEDIKLITTGTGKVEVKPGADGGTLFQVTHNNTNSAFQVLSTNYEAIFGQAANAVSINPAANALTVSGGGTFDIRASSFASFTITNPKLQWPNSSPTLSVIAHAAGVLGIRNGSTGSGKLTIGDSSAGSTSRLTIASDLSAAAWGTAGIALQGTAAIFTDTSTAAAGTAATAAVNSFGQSTLASTNSITTTDAYGLYLAGAPIAGANQTLTNSTALYIAAAATVDGTGGTPTNSYGLQVNAQTGASNNYTAVFAGGNVGIGDATPTSLLTVGSGDLFQINSSGVVAAGTWNATAITDTYVADTLTLGSGSSVHWDALNNYPAACSAGSAISALADTTNTCTSFNTDTVITLQDAYDATSGSSITTTNNRDIDIVLANTATDSNLDIVIATDSTSTVSISRAAGSGTANPSQLLLIEDSDADLTIADGITIRTAGVLTDAIDLSDAEIVNAINVGSNNIITGATTVASAELDRLDGKDAALVDTNDAVATAIIGTGALNSGSITSGFGAIDVGADAITTTGTIGTAAQTVFTGNTITASGATAANGGITFDASTDTIGAFTAAGTIDLATNILTNIGNTGTDFIASTGALTLAGVLTANAGVTLGASQDIITTAGTGTLTLNSTVINASDDAFLITPVYTGGATDTLTYNAISIAAQTATNAAGTDILNGIKIGNLTESGAGAITSAAINIGSGWDAAIHVNGTTVSLTELASLNGGVTLGSETNGDYVASFTAGTGLTGDGSGEGSTPTIAVSTGSGVTTSGDNIVLDQNFNPTWTADHTWTLVGAEDLTVSHDLAGSVSVFNITATPSGSAGTTNGVSIAQADSSNSNGLDRGILVDNADTNLAITDGIKFTNTGGGGYTNFLETPSIDISGAGAISGATGISSAGTIAFSGLSTNGAVYTSGGTGTLNSEANLDVTRGGTGVGTFTANGIIYGNTTSDLLVTAAGTTGQCLVGNTGSAPAWSTCSGLVTLQSAYDATSGNTIAATDARDIAFTLTNTSTDPNFTITTAASGAGFTSISLADGSNTTPPAQLVLVDNLDTNQALAIGLKVQSAAGTITTALDVSDSDIGTALAIGSNDITTNAATISSAELDRLDGKNAALIDTNDAVDSAITGTGALGTGSITSGFGAIDIGSDTITSGVVNGQTISSSANFTGSIAVAGAITNATSYNGLVVTANTGVITTGTWNGTAVTDTYVADTLTLGSGSSVHWDALNNYPAACSAGSAISSLADTTNTCTSFNTDTSITLQDAYGAGGSITTTDNRDIDIVLANTSTDSNLDIVIATDSTSTVSISRAAGAGTGNPSQLLVVEDLDSDLTIADGITVRTAGVLTDAIDLSDAEIVNAINVGANTILGTTGIINYNNFDVDASGNVTLAGDLTVSGGNITNAITFDAGLLVAAAQTITIGGDAIDEFVGTGLTLSSGDLQTTLGTAIDSSEITDNTIDWTDIVNASSLDAATSITGTAGEVLSVVRTLTNNTAEDAITISVTASDTGAATTGQYGLSLTNAASTEGLDALAYLNNADSDDVVVSGILIQSAAGLITTALDVSDAEIDTAIAIGSNDVTVGGATLSSTEFARLDGKDAALVDTNDAVNTAITGTGALGSGSITSGFGAIDIGSDTITSGAINSQTISSSANFTGSIAIAGAVTNATSYNGLVVTANTGVVTTGTWNATAITDTYVADTLTLGSGSSVHWDALNNYPAACSAGSAISALADTTNTCTSFNTDTSITLQDAYGAGGSITTTDNKDIDIVLANTSTDSNLDIVIATDSTSTVSISRAAGAGTGNPSQLLVVEDLDADLTIADGITVRTAGVLTDALDLSDAEIVNAINIGSNNIITGATTISSAELDRLDGKDAALVDTNDAVSTAITGVGTIGTGVWQGTAVSAQYGGTGLNTSASSGVPSINSGTWQSNAITQNGVLYGGASNALSFTAQGGANTVLVANAGVPSFSAAITVGTSVTSPTINATSVLQLNGTSINTGGTLTNVAYLDQANIFTANQTITKADPSLVLNVTTATDTDFWVGVQDDAGGDDDDKFQIGDGTTPGTNPFLTLDTSGNVGIGTTSPDGKLEIAGDVSASAWGLNGIALQGTAATYTDSSTAGSGTATNAVFNSFGRPTLAATNASVTTTNAATVYVANSPLAGTNQTITNPYALWVDDGITRLDGALVLDASTSEVCCGVTAKLKINSAGSDAPLYIYNGGSDYFYINTTGKVGIGSITAASKLSVSGNASIGAGYQSTAAPTNGLIVEGNVGIGDASPTAALTVGSGDLFQVASTGALTFNGVTTDITTGTNEALTIAPNGTGSVLINSGVTTGSGSSSGLQVTTSTLSSGVLATFSSTSTGAASNSQQVLSVTTSGLNATDGQLTYAAGISNSHTGATLATNIALTLSASGGSTNYSLYSTSGNAYFSGNVGIGSTSAEALLEVQGTEATDAVIALDADDGDDASDTWFIKALAAGSNALSILNDTTEVLNLSTGGALQIDGDLTVSGDDLFMGTNTDGFILVADGTNYNPVAVSGDITITNAGATSIVDSKVTEADLKAVDAASDEECLTYETTTGDFEWQACTVVTADSLDFIDFEDTLDLDATLVLNQGTNTWTQNFTGTTTTGLSLVANSLTTGTGLSLASSSLTSGSLANIAVTGTGAASNTQKALNVSSSGTSANNQTTYAGYFANSTTGTDNTNIGLYVQANNGYTNIAGQFQALVAGGGVINVGLHAYASTSASDYINLVLGSSVPTTGNYSIYSSSTSNSYFAGGIGIGTTTPQSLLDVQGPTGTGAASAGILTLATKELTIVDGDQLGRINFNSPLESDGSDAILAGAAIWAEADDTFTTTVNSTELVFGTATTSAAIERMRIDSSGNVGIGDTTPAALLTVGNEDLFQINSSGVVVAGTWNATAITDTYVADTLTSSIFIGSGSTTNAIDLATAEVAGTLADGNVSDALTVSSSGSVHWDALNNYPAACSAGSAISALADTTNTCTSFNTDTSITLQDAYGAGGTIETASNTSVIITETTAAGNTGDLLQLTSNVATGGAHSGDLLQLTMDAVDANGYTGHGIHMIIDQSQNTGNAILIEDDLAVALFQLDENGGLTLGAAAAQTTAITITDTDYTNALSIGDNNITGTTFTLSGTTSTIDFTDFDVDSDGKVTLGPDTSGDAVTIAFGAALDMQAIVIDAATNVSTATNGIVDIDFKSVTNNASALDINVENSSTATSGTRTVSGLSISPVITAAGASGTHEIVGTYIQAASGTAGAGTQNLYGVRIGNQGAGTNIETTYGLYVDSQSGATTASYAAIFAGGNVGIGDTSPVHKLQVVDTGGSTPILSLRPTNSSVGDHTLMSFLTDNFDTNGWTIGNNALNNNFEFYESIGVTSPRLVLEAGGSIGIGTTSPVGLLNIQGTNSNALLVEDGSGNDILQVDSSSSSTNAGLDITAGASQSSNLLNFYSSGGSTLASFGSSAAFTQNISSTTAFQLQNGSGTGVFTFDTTNSKVGIGTTTISAATHILTSMAVTQTNANPSLSSGTAAGIIVSSSDTDAPTVLIRNSAGSPCVGQFTGCSGAVAAGGEGILTIEGNDGTNTTRYNLLTAYNNNTRSAAAAVFRVRADGNVYGEASFNASGADYAEYFDSADTTIEAGDLVVATTIDEALLRKASAEVRDEDEVNTLDEKSVWISAVEKSSMPYDSKIVGIVSNNPAFIGNNPGGRNDLNPNKKLIGLVGRLSLKISLENGPIAVGDFLTASATKPGYAMKATQSGYVVGQALENFTEADALRQQEQEEQKLREQGIINIYTSSTPPTTGTILTFISPQYYVQSLSELLIRQASTNGTKGQDTFLSDLSNLNITDASVFGNIGVKGNLYVQQGLHVAGTIFAAKLEADTITAKEKLCIKQTCVTEDQLKAVLELLNGQGSVAGSSTPPPPSEDPPPAPPEEPSAEE